MITGKSGVGKSETALELVKKGHRLVADDCVEIHQEGENTLVGHPPKLIEHLLEIRVSHYRHHDIVWCECGPDFQTDFIVIDLELWDAEKTYDRLDWKKKKCGSLTRT
nr:hypothetical protein [Planococcus salinarum]